MATLITPLSGWGRYPVQSCELQRPERYADLTPDAVNCAAITKTGIHGQAANKNKTPDRI